MKLSRNGPGEYTPPSVLVGGQTGNRHRPMGMDVSPGASDGYRSVTTSSLSEIKHSRRKHEVDGSSTRLWKVARR
jgi:hypothetical protein